MNAANAVLYYRRLFALLFDACVVVVSYWLAFLLRFEFPIESEDFRRFLITLPLVLVLRLAAFAWFQLYDRLWRYVSMKDILAILKAVTVSSLFVIPIILGAIDRHFPWPIFPIDWGICLLFVGGMRLALRAYHESLIQSREATGRRALIIGAGDAGELLIREVGRNASLNYQIVGFVDDDPSKQGRRIHGVEVVGTVDQLAALCRKYHAQELLIAVPSAAGTAMRRIIGACRASKLDFKTMPSLVELNESPFTLSKVRRVSIDDLLRREPVRIDHAEVERFILGRRILVTGAGGSIGSELCRQLARFTPEKLVLLDRAENSLFFVEMELREKFLQLVVCPVIADVTDEGRIQSILQEHKPHIVFHAAAYKHVPMMELNTSEAVKNNVRGTMVVAEASWRNGVEDFVLISTDKAVRPSSIMGATKRLAELYVQSLNARIETRFMTVRFGNVLGSEGSVLQVFQRQIEAGGPVTVTHPDMMRYFMTIPEACQLVLQAATQGEGGEIFLLDMGEPVRIVDLARDLITLMGREPDKDIEIKFTGVRPGEKMFEELLSSGTRVMPTTHEKIVVMETTPVDHDRLEVGIRELIADAKAGREEALVPRLQTLVPEYRGIGEQVIAPSGTPDRILLAAPDAYTRSTLRRILETGYELAEADSRRQLIEKLDKCAPHLVILDGTLPTMSIRRLCARIKNGNGHPPPSIILLTESAEAASLDQVRALGADDRLYRPIPVSVVEKRVRGLLRKAEAR